MSGVKDSFVDLERHTLQLEEQVKKLQKDLQHWQTWDAEYEALKEEVDDVSYADAASLAHIKDGFEGELLKPREIEDIFGGKNTRSKDQIKNVLDRRIDYVTKNIESLQKQLEAAENKYAAATVISQPDAIDEDGQPITEIIETLDDDDNVISYQLNKPGNSLSQLEDVLEKAGIKDLPESEPVVSQESLKQQPQQKEVHQQPVATDQPVAKAQPVNKSVTEPLRSESPANKGVSFAPDTKPGDEPKPQVSRNAKRVEQIIKTAKDQEAVAGHAPVIPDDEDEDDAEMRRQMLAYGMGEVGAVVAELELDEGDTDDEDDYEFDYSDEGFEDDEEDKFGRSTGSVLTGAYHQRMLELEKKLGIQSRFTAQEPADEDGESSSDDERIGRIVVKRSPEVQSAASKPTPSKSSIKEKEPAEPSGKKGVRFASNLDIATESEAVAPLVQEITDKDSEPLVEPLSDVVERSGPAKAVEPKATRKPSRFKKARGDAPTATGVPPGPLDLPVRFLDQDRPTAPTGPEGTTLADTLVERDTSAAPTPIGEFDDDMIQDEVANEYHRMRKKFIQREGGFLKEDESPIQPLDEAEGGPARVSRFKAAKLSRQ
ncbi:Prefoldin subunit-domain-containing protein [Dactylonectria estremocensis]|uniref:Prefoldin subunit-domain-containing protein n=1 Tax=Dactylonectria estremocensis TaxID=1079267 RepID=A0A9P9J9C2_9HYPO|nr:Prefoldin subunit-domain-containing protein [Dactylonectria estremocensis]